MDASSAPNPPPAKRPSRQLWFGAALAGDARALESALDARPELLDAQNQAGLSAAMLAAQHGRGACLRLLLAKGCDVHASDAHGRSALALAIMSTPLTTPATDCVEALVGAGARVDPRDGATRQLAWRACMAGKTRMLGILLRAGCPLEWEGDGPGSLLRVASALGSPATASGLAALAMVEAEILRRSGSEAPAASRPAAALRL